MNLQDLQAACPDVDFSQSYNPQSNTKFSIGSYIIKNLPKTFDIIKSTTHLENDVIVNFVKAQIKDHHLPYEKDYLMKNLQCSDTFTEDFLLAQSKFFAISFEPQEYKKLGKLDFVPFVVDPHTKIRAGGYGMVEKVFEGSKSFAKKTILDNDDVGKIMMELKILGMATATGNAHLLHLRCAFKQDNRTYLILSPWCDMDLSTFLKTSHSMCWWTQLSDRERLILITNWMACLASGLSALHKSNIKHQNLKPENILLDEEMQPIICDFGLSKAFNGNSKSVKVQCTRAYFPPEQFHEKVGRKGDIFSLGLVFVELGLFIFGRPSLKSLFLDVDTPFYMDIRNDLDNFFNENFPLPGETLGDSWVQSFRDLLKCMLKDKPEERPKASAIWETLKAMVEGLGGTAHCEQVSPLGSIPNEQDEEGEEMEIQLSHNITRFNL